MCIYICHTCLDWCYAFSLFISIYLQNKRKNADGTSCTFYAFSDQFACCLRFLFKSKRHSELSPFHSVIFYKETNLKKTPSQRRPKTLRKALAAIVSSSVCAACIISYFHVRSDSLLDIGQSIKLIAFHICACDSFLRNFRAFSSTSKRYGEKRFAIGKYQEISLISWQERRSVLLGRCTSVRSVEFIPCRKEEQSASLQ